jgi:hypothetical protein
MITTLNARARNPFIDGSSHGFNPLRGFRSPFFVSV